ncbi:hypothetical protein LCGC14_0529110 [marine sediment metagenome]|uniref:Uncharacterized protein n=1 Tax=marine sediment metagenome TaxID=412755 RepID=A0A0F9SEG8_9ZZZZ
MFPDLIHITFPIILVVATVVLLRQFMKGDGP